MCHSGLWVGPNLFFLGAGTPAALAAVGAAGESLLGSCPPSVNPGACSALLAGDTGFLSQPPGPEQHLDSLCRQLTPASLAPGYSRSAGGELPLPCLSPPPCPASCHLGQPRLPVPSSGCLPLQQGLPGVPLSPPGFHTEVEQTQVYKCTSSDVPGADCQRCPYQLSDLGQAT